MPYVEGFGTWPFGEEWLWEAVACVYLPLLDAIDGAPITVGLTPVLCDQLEAMRGETGERFIRFLDEIRSLVHSEDSAGLERGGEPELAAEVRRAAGDYVRAGERFEERGRDLLGAFAALERVEPGTPRPPTPCCRCSPPTRACVCSSPPAQPGTSAGSASGAGASGCPSAPTSPGSSATSPTTACGPSAWTRRSSRDSITYAQSPPRPGRWRCRSTGERSSWCGTSATAIRRAGPTGTTTAGRSTT